VEDADFRHTGYSEVIAYSCLKRIGPGKRDLRNAGVARSQFPRTRLTGSWPCQRRRESGIVNLPGGNDMAKNRLRDAAVKIGSAVGRVDGKAHKAALKAAQAAHVTRQELIDLSKQVDALKRQLKKSTKRLRSALK
jgi:hypothetical protein